MNKQELSNSLKIAQSNEKLGNEDISNFLGFGLKDFPPIYCTTNQIAALIRYQCIQMNGKICSNALQEIGNASRKFIIL